MKNCNSIIKLKFCKTKNIIKKGKCNLQSSSMVCKHEIYGYLHILGIAIFVYEEGLVAVFMEVR